MGVCGGVEVNGGSKKDNKGNCSKTSAHPSSEALLMSQETFQQIWTELTEPTKGVHLPLQKKPLRVFSKTTSGEAGTVQRIMISICIPCRSGWTDPGV